MARTYNHATFTYSKAKNGNEYLSHHFQVKEFACKDGADEIVICPDLISGLELLFTKMGARAINITSGYRTVKHSLAIGAKGATDNHHLGMAADVKVRKPDGSFFTPKEICITLEDMGWNGGIGYMNTAVHIDVGSKLYFDETKNSKTVKSWRAYWGLQSTATSVPTQTTQTHRGTAYTITCSMLKVRKAASTFSRQVGQYSRGEVFYVVAQKGNWCQLESGNWMCAGKYLKKV